MRELITGCGLFAVTLTELLNTIGDGEAETLSFLIRSFSRSLEHDFDADMW